jgi:hypothetical protein
VVRYTLDGSDPSESSTQYSGPLALTESATVKARSYKSGLAPSDVAGETFTKNAYGKVVYPNGGEVFQVGEQVTIVVETYDLVNFNEAIISVTIDDGRSWHPVNPSSLFLDEQTGRGEYVWTVPATIGGVHVEGNAGVIKVTQYNGLDIDESDQPFCLGAGCEETGVRDGVAARVPAAPMTMSLARGSLRITFNRPIPHWYAVVDCRGVTVARATGAGYASYSVTGLAAGTYLVRLSNGVESLTRTVVVIR